MLQAVLSRQGNRLVGRAKPLVAEAFPPSPLLLGRYGQIGPNLADHDVAQQRHVEVQRLYGLHQAGVAAILHEAPLPGGLFATVPVQGDAEPLVPEPDPDQPAILAPGPLLSPTLELEAVRGEIGDADIEEGGEVVEDVLDFRAGR